MIASGCSWASRLSSAASARIRLPGAITSGMRCVPAAEKSATPSPSAAATAMTNGSVAGLESPPVETPSLPAETTTT